MIPYSPDTQFTLHTCKLVLAWSCHNMCMLLIISLLFLLPSTLSSPSSRNLVQMYSMVAMETNCSLAELVTLTKYKNWCGLGDNGEPPKDSLDACCEQHDNCYGDIQDTGLCLPHPIMEDYLWTVQDNQDISCGVCQALNSTGKEDEDDKDVSFFQKMSLFLSWKEDPSCTCSSCQCDLQLALCLRRIGHCAPPLFGVPGFIDEKLNSLRDMAIIFIGKAGNAFEGFVTNLVDTLG